MGFLGTYDTYDVLLKSKNMKPKTLFLAFLIVFLMLNSFTVFPVQANPDTLTLRPSAAGTYSQFVEVANSGFIWGDQFEIADFSQWTGTVTSAGCTSAVTTNLPYHGSYSAQFTVASGEGNAAYAKKTITPSGTNMTYARFYMQWNITASYFVFAGLYSGSTVMMYVNLESATTCSVKYRNGTALTSASYFTTANTANTWYCFEMYTFVNATNGNYTLWKNGVNIWSVTTGVNSGNYGNITQFYVGELYNGAGAHTTTVDSVAISSSYIGTENRPALVNDSSDNTALQVTSNTTQKETELLATTSQTGTINSVTMDMRAEASTTSIQALTVTRTHGTDYEGSATTISNTAFTDYTTVYSTNPNTGIAWTWAEVNALEVGARASTLPSGTIQFSEFYIIVDYQSDVTPPTYSRISTNTTLANNPCSFNVLVSDDTNVSTYIFSTNNTGTWTNDTATTFSNFFNTTAAWANVTKTLNDTIGNVVSYLWYANDTNNNWSSSGQFKLPTRERPNLQITPDNVTCRKYLEAFTVQINVTNAVNIQAFNFTIYYDPQVLNCSSVSSGELANAFTVTIDNTNGIVEGNLAGSPINGNRSLLNITFQAAEGLIWKEGLANKLESKIWFHQAEIGFADNSTLKYVEGGVNQINVNQMAYTFLPIRGDVNNDGTVNIQDIRTVAAYYGKTIADPEWTEASKYDLTNDNTIDIFDLILVATNFGFTYP